jgi:hypothetical protein
MLPILPLPILLGCWVVVRLYQMGIFYGFGLVSGLFNMCAMDERFLYWKLDLCVDTSKSCCGIFSGFGLVSGRPHPCGACQLARPDTVDKSSSCRCH